MRIGVMSVFVDYHRRGAKNRVSLQAQIGPLIAGLLPREIEIDIVNGTWQDPDWQRDYDLLFISALHSDFDRARQISHYWRRRGAKTVCGGRSHPASPSSAAPGSIRSSSATPRRPCPRSTATAVRAGSRRATSHGRTRRRRSRRRATKRCSARASTRSSSRPRAGARSPASSACSLGSAPATTRARWPMCCVTSSPGSSWSTPACRSTSGAWSASPTTTSAASRGCANCAQRSSRLTCSGTARRASTSSPTATSSR